MSSSRATPFLFIAALLFAAVTPPPAHAQRPNLINGVTFIAPLCCTPTGNCTVGSPPLNGTTVSLICTPVLGATVTLGQNTTNANGVVNITVPIPFGLQIPIVNGLLPCVAAVALPLSPVVCPVLSTLNGTLASAIATTGNVVTEALGLVRVLTPLGFNVTIGVRV